MTPEQLRTIERRANQQLGNDAHWWLWTQELKGRGLKARLGRMVEDTKTKLAFTFQGGESLWQRSMILITGGCLS